MTYKLLVFQTAYPYSMISSLNLESYISSKDPGGFFDQVLTVNSLASLQDHEFLCNGEQLKFYKLDHKHSIIESAHQLRLFRNRSAKASFILSQLNLIIRLLLGGYFRKVSLVYADDALYNGFLGCLVSKLLRVPLVIGIWGNPSRIRETTGKPLMPNLFKSVESEAKFERFFLKRANAIQVQNNENATYPLSIGISPQLVSKLPLAVGISDFHFVVPEQRRSDRHYESLDSEVFNLVCISRLEDLKHVDHVIESVVMLKKNLVKFRLHIIGAGSREQQLRSYAKEIGLEEEIIFHGIQTQEWISSFLPLMDVAIAPLTGRALLEIALSGLPVIAYDVDWHDEIVTDGVTGTLVEYLNANALGRAIVENFRIGDSARKAMGRDMRLKAIELSDPILLGNRQNMFFLQLVNPDPQINDQSMVFD